MRTTLNLPDALLTEAKVRAEAEGRTLTSLLEESLREHLNRPGAERAPIILPSWSAGEALVDLDDKDALWDVLDDRP